MAEHASPNDGCQLLSFVSISSLSGVFVFMFIQSMRLLALQHQCLRPWLALVNQMSIRLMDDTSLPTDYEVVV